MIIHCSIKNHNIFVEHPCVHGTCTCTVNEMVRLLMLFMIIINVINCDPLCENLTYSAKKKFFFELWK